MTSTPVPIEIRPARPHDADPLFPLVQRFATSFTPQYDAFARSLGEVVGDPSSLAIVATRDGAVVGYLLADVHPTFFADGPVVWIEEVMVDESVRRLGVGRRLMEHAEGWAAGRGAAYVSLATRRASDFYLALGYDESAVFFRKLLR